MDEPSIFTCVRHNWKSFVIILLPIFLLPMVVTGNKSMQCGYIIAIVAIFWVTEAMHIAVTSLIPIVLFPAFGILKPGVVAACYMKDITLMIIGGLIIAKTIEHQNLHRRMALHLLKFMGPNPVFQYLGFMISTWVLSMWISNTATTTMMVTLANSVIDQWQYVKKTEETSSESNNEQLPSEMPKSEKSPSLESSEQAAKENKRIHDVGKGLLISIAYSASVGGIATMSGTPPNLVFYGILQDRYKQTLGLNYGTFMLFGLPLSIICFIILWLTLTINFIGFEQVFRRKVNTKKDKSSMRIIEDEIHNLGNISYGELSTLVVFILLVCLWIFREPGFPMFGWLFTRVNAAGKTVRYWTDGLSAILATLLVFNLPTKNPFKNYKRKINRLIDWKYIEKGFPWGFVFLFGAGFALATGCEESGLSVLVGKYLTKLKHLPHYVIVLIVSFGIAFFTEFTSNTVTASVLLPIMITMAECIHMHPLKIGLAVTIACSFAFCLPAATPPNAIVFSTGKVHVKDMAACGIFLNIVFTLILSFMVYVYSVPLYGTSSFPDFIVPNCTNLES